MATSERALSRDDVFALRWIAGRGTVRSGGFVRLTRLPWALAMRVPGLEAAGLIERGTPGHGVVRLTALGVDVLSAARE